MGLLGRLFRSSEATPVPAFAAAFNQWYQPDAVQRARIPDFDSMIQFAKRITAAGEEYWAAAPKGVGQSMTILAAIKPGGLSRFWVETSPGGLTADELAPFIELLEWVPAPLVHGGPVAFSTHAFLWGGRPSGEGLKLITDQEQFARTMASDLLGTYEREGWVYLPTKSQSWHSQKRPTRRGHPECPDATV
jgi:hypothetical protein